jgi:hypothetical protein
MAAAPAARKLCLLCGEHDAATLSRSTWNTYGTGNMRDTRQKKGKRKTGRNRNQSGIATAVKRQKFFPTIQSLKDESGSASARKT